MEIKINTGSNVTTFKHIETKGKPTRIEVECDNVDDYVYNFETFKSADVLRPILKRMQGGGILIHSHK